MQAEDTQPPAPSPAADEPGDDAVGRGATDHASFVLRFAQELWRDDAGAPRVRWRGHIRHVQTDESARFTDFAAAVGFIQQHLARLTAESVSGADAPERELAMADSLRIWERFAESYASMMGAAVERTVERSEAAQRQFSAAVAQTEATQRQMAEAFQRSLRAWNPLLAPGTASEPPADADERVLEAIESLRAELRALRVKVDGLGGAPS